MPPTELVQHMQCKAFRPGIRILEEAYTVSAKIN